MCFNPISYSEGGVISISNVHPIFEVTAEISISQCIKYNIALLFSKQKNCIHHSTKIVMKSAQLQLNP